MSVRRQAWKSGNTGREMPIVRYGDRGTPVLYIPTSGGDETEFERYGMPEVCAPWIDAGKIQVLSIDGFGPRTLFDDALDPTKRFAAYARFERYAVDELLPHIRQETGVERPVVLGASYGALVAANLIFKHPERIDMACGLGGVYGMWHRLDRHHDDDVYFHTPLEYMPPLADERILAAIRATRGISIYAAGSDEWLHSSLDMVRVLRERRLPHRVEVWPSPASHDEYWWRMQLRQFLARELLRP
ncbi:MAG: hypothetical protein GY716_08215 [bacterium]|nr:hypothetical protein [bacterium]